MKRRLYMSSKHSVLIVAGLGGLFSLVKPCFRPKLDSVKRTLLLAPALIACLSLTSAAQLAAQTFTLLHSFTAGSAGCQAGLMLSGNTLYGTTAGTLFAINTNGTGFTTLHTFNGRDGAGLRAGLILSSNILYGTAAQGGVSDCG